MLDTANSDLDVKKESAQEIKRPPLPPNAHPVQLTDNARTVLSKRYLRRDANGQPIETVEEMVWRVAYHVALAEESWGGDVMHSAGQFYDLLATKRFFPN